MRHNGVQRPRRPSTSCAAMLACSHRTRTDVPPSVAMLRIRSGLAEGRVGRACPEHRAPVGDQHRAMVLPHGLQRQLVVDPSVAQLLDRVQHVLASLRALESRCPTGESEAGLVESPGGKDRREGAGRGHTVGDPPVGRGGRTRGGSRPAILVAASTSGRRTASRCRSRSRVAPVTLPGPPIPMSRNGGRPPRDVFRQLISQGADPAIEDEPTGGQQSRIERMAADVVRGELAQRGGDQPSRPPTRRSLMLVRPPKIRLRRLLNRRGFMRPADMRSANSTV